MPDSVFVTAAIAAGTVYAFGQLHKWQPLPEDIAGRIGKVAAHGTVGGVASRLRGGSFRAGFLAAGFSQSLEQTGVYKRLGLNRFDKVGPDGRLSMSGGLRMKNAVVAAVAGGTGAVLGGGKFANGAITGAFSRLYNDLWAVGAGGSVVAVVGVEGNVGVAMEFGDRDLGEDPIKTASYGSWGLGRGLNVSVDIFVGYYEDSFSVLSGSTDNLNFVVMGLSLTLVYEAGTWNFLGGTAGLGVGIALGFSYSNPEGDYKFNCGVLDADTSC